MILKAVHTLIKEADVANKFAKYDFGSGLEPCVTTQDPAPLDSGNPVCTLVQVVGSTSTDAETRVDVGTDIGIDINIWGDKIETDKGIRALAWSVHALFFGKHTSVLSVTGWTVEEITITAPRRTTDSDGYPGYEMFLTVSVTQTRS